MRRILAAFLCLLLLTGAVGSNPYRFPEVVVGWTPSDSDGKFSVDSSGNTLVEGVLTTAPSTTSSAGLIIQPGTTPSAPTNGQVWVTTLGIYVQINGGTVGPLGTGGGGVSGPTPPTTDRAIATWDGTTADALRNTGVTITAADVISSPVTTGTSPLTILSTTLVSNLNADLLDGGDWTAPGTIGSVTPNTGSFTSITASSTATVSGTLNVNGAVLASDDATFTLLASPTTVNAFGAATTITMGTTTGNGNAYFGSAAAGSYYVGVRASAGNSHGFKLYTDNSTRWAIFQNNTAESPGSDAGSWFTVASYTDAGAFKSTVLQIRRDTSQITLSGPTIIAADLAVNSDDLTTNSATINVFNTTATTANIFGAATDIDIGESATGVSVDIGNGSGAPRVQIFGGGGSLRLLRFHTSNTGNSTRWALGADDDAEGGSDEGSNFLLRKFTDTGGTEDVLFLPRESGNFVLTRGITSLGNADFQGGDLDIGGLLDGFTGIRFDSVELEFWIDGTQVASIHSDGTYNDDI